MLCEAGCLLDLQDKDGFAALHWAAFRLNPDMLSLFARPGVNFNIKNAVGFVCFSDCMQSGQAPLWFACYARVTTLFSPSVLILRDNGANLFELVPSNRDIVYLPTFIRRHYGDSSDAMRVCKDALERMIATQVLRIVLACEELCGREETLPFEMMYRQTCDLPMIFRSIFLK